MARPACAATSTWSAMPASATLAADQLHALLDREQPAGLLVVVHHGDGHVAEQLDALLDDVEVPEVDRVEAAGVEHGRHGCRNVVRPAVSRRRSRWRNVTHVRP